jgi:flagellar biogenesis protein FliO
MESLVLQLLVIGLFLGALVVFWRLKQNGLLQISRALHSSSPGPAIRIITRKSLTNQHALFLLDVGGQTLLVATSPGSCQILDRPGDKRVSTGVEA